MLLKNDTALGIYVHIPFCIRKCNYCDFPSYSNMDNIFSQYTNALCKEIEFVSEKYKNGLVDTIFFGGGTPSVLSAKDISKICNTIQKKFRISNNAEISIEVNPGTITKEKLETYRALNINRISIGVQSANDRILNFMGRIHTRQMIEQSLELIKECGFKNINADIIFGVPNQTMVDLQDTIEFVLNKEVTHISCYSLKVEENTPWYELQKRGELPQVDDGLEREMYYWIVSRLKNSSFEHYEISNFAKPGFKCIHNIKYWTDKPYLGFGSAAHSYINNTRYSNVENPVEYISAVNANKSPIQGTDIIDDVERLSEIFILGLRLIEGVNLEALEHVFGRKSLKKYDEKIEMLVNKDFLCIENGNLKLTKLGLDFANLVWVEFI
ncbi:MAG: radical SAM family heme chaperone HemW [Clostridiaceae bacterium]|jgi:oxygen-independent coproporphyrinogen-3 oxidase|nr:radical SAM family heme chaperone HemW [Clostridiaceae bacterium]